MNNKNSRWKELLLGTISEDYISMMLTTWLPLHQWQNQETEKMMNLLSKSPGFSLRLQEGQDVSFSDGALDIPDDGSIALIQELNSDLSTLSLWSCPSKQFSHSGQLQFVYSFVHFVSCCGSLRSIEWIEQEKARNSKHFSKTNVRITSRKRKDGVGDRCFTAICFNFSAQDFSVASDKLNNNNILADLWLWQICLCRLDHCLQF